MQGHAVSESPADAASWEKMLSVLYSNIFINSWECFFCTNHRGRSIFYFFIPEMNFYFVSRRGFLSGKRLLSGATSCSQQTLEFGARMVPPLHSHPTESERASPSPCQFTRWHQLACCIKADGREHNVGATPQSSGKTAVAPRLIETSPRPISTDGCHMYANKEQSESRSPISTTCLPHTAPPESPFSIHTHTHTHTTYPPNPFGGTSLFSLINSCI